MRPQEPSDMETSVEHKAVAREYLQLGVRLTGERDIDKAVEAFFTLPSSLKRRKISGRYQLYGRQSASYILLKVALFYFLPKNGRLTITSWRLKSGVSKKT